MTTKLTLEQLEQKIRQIKKPKWLKSKDFKKNHGALWKKYIASRKKKLGGDILVFEELDLKPPVKRETEKVHIDDNDGFSSDDDDFMDTGQD